MRRTALFAALAMLGSTPGAEAAKTRAMTAQKMQTLLRFVGEMSAMGPADNCDVFRSRKGYRGFRQIMDEYIDSDELILRLKTDLREDANACYKPDDSFGGLGEWSAILLYAKSEKFREFFIQQKKNVLSDLLIEIARYNAVSGPMAYEIVHGHSSKAAWCAEFAQAMVRGIDCTFSDPEETEKLKDHWPEKITGVDEVIESTTSWMWGVSTPESAALHYEEAPGDLRRDECEKGDLAVWGKVRKGHVSFVVDDEGSTVGGNESNSVDHKSPNESLGSSYGGKRWRGCVPAWGA